MGTKNPVQVKAGDKIYLSIIQATQSDLKSGSSDVCPIFGGDRSKTPHPIHACPGFEMGFGILLGVNLRYRRSPGQGRRLEGARLLRLKKARGTGGFCCWNERSPTGTFTPAAI